MHTLSALYKLVNTNIAPKNSKVIKYASRPITKRLSGMQPISFSNIQNASRPNISAHIMPSSSPVPRVNRFSQKSTLPTCLFSSPSTAYSPNSRFLLPIRKLLIYTMKKNANIEKTTMPYMNILCAVFPFGRPPSPSENISPAISRYTPLITAVAIICGKYVRLSRRMFEKASFA